MLCGVHISAALRHQTPEPLHGSGIDEAQCTHGKPAVESLAARPGSGHGVALWLVLAPTWLRPGPSQEEAKKTLARPVLVVLMRSGPILHHLVYGLLRHWS